MTAKFKVGDRVFYTASDTGLTDKLRGLKLEVVQVDPTFDEPAVRVEMPSGERWWVQSTRVAQHPDVSLPSDPVSPYHTAAAELATLVEEKNKAYGSSFSTAPKILELLFPNGIQPEQYGSLLTIARVLDKLSRIATDKDAFGENPWKDVAGYSLLEVVKQKETP